MKERNVVRTARETTKHACMYPCARVLATPNKAYGVKTLHCSISMCGSILHINEAMSRVASPLRIDKTVGLKPIKDNPFGRGNGLGGCYWSGILRLDLATF